MAVSAKDRITVCIITGRVATRQRPHLVPALEAVGHGLRRGIHPDHHSLLQSPSNTADTPLGAAPDALCQYRVGDRPASEYCCFHHLDADFPSGDRAMTLRESTK